MQLIHFAKLVTSTSDFVLMHRWVPKKQVRSLCRRRARISRHLKYPQTFLRVLLWNRKELSNSQLAAQLAAWRHTSGAISDAQVNLTWISHRSCDTSETPRQTPWIPQGISDSIKYIYTIHRIEPMWPLAPADLPAQGAETKNCNAPCATASFASFLLSCLLCSCNEVLHERTKGPPFCPTYGR